MEKTVALTFDDGPNNTTTCEVLDVLEKYGVIGSFFLIGENITGETAKTVRRAFEMGCEINNHSKTHRDMTKLSAEEIKGEFEYTDEKVFEITGRHTKFFRPPYISVNDAMISAIEVPFIAGAGTEDWKDEVSAERRAGDILRQAADGVIILLHDKKGNSKTVKALDMIIPELKERGFGFVTVSELFRRKGIEPVKGKIYGNVFQKGLYS